MSDEADAKFGVGKYGLADYGSVEVSEVVPSKNAKYGVAGFGQSAYGLVLTPAFSDPRNCLFSLVARQKVRTGGAGFVGIYQTQPTSKGRIVRRLKLYSPTNPRTEAQQAHRQKYGEAVEAWRDLTDEQKLVYNKKAKGRPLSGYNLFVKEYLLSH